MGPQKKKYIEHPDLKPPDGEPFERFERRWGGALRQFMKHNEANPEDQIALVIHGNMDMSAPAIVGGEKVTAGHYDRQDAAARLHFGITLEQAHRAAH